MLLWIALAVLTAAVLAAVLAPLGRSSRQEATADAGALEVYRHQLDELEAERARVRCARPLRRVARGRTPS